MRKPFIRLLSLVLCAAMLCTLMPALATPAAAAQTKTIRTIHEMENGVISFSDETVAVEEEEVIIPEPIAAPREAEIVPMDVTDNGGYYGFTSFEDLKELASKTYDNYVNAQYHGTEELVIAEDLTIPEKLSVNVTSTVRVPEGVTLTAPRTSSLYVTDLIVEGTLNTSAYLMIRESLNVTGSVIATGQIFLDQTAVVTGDENVTFNDYGFFDQSIYVFSMDDLKNALAMAASVDASKWSFRIVYNSNMDLLINESVTIPDHVIFNVSDSSFTGMLTIAEGCTVTVEGDMSILHPITVAGTLEYNGNYGVLFYDDGAKITFTGSGKLTGTGKLMVRSKTLTDVSLALPGLNLADYEVKTVSGSVRHISVKYTPGLIQLGAPSELTWGVNDEWRFDEATGTGKLYEVAMPGAMKFKSGSPNLGRIRVEVFREEGETDDRCYYCTVRFGVTETPEYYYWDSFTADTNPVSGDYYFTITSEGDGTQYRDSETATSGIWSYVKPSAQLSAPTNLYWDGRNAHFTLPSNDYTGGYYIHFYFAKTLEDTPYTIGSSFSHNKITTTEQYGELYDWALQNGGAGYYSFKVKTLSSNLEIMCNSEFSEFSEPVYISANNSDLDSIVDSSATMSEDEIRDAVQGIGAEELEKAMLADKTGTEAIAQLTQLEEAVGGPAEIQVTEDAYDFDPSKISVVGANLNTAASEDEDITLVVDKPEKDHVIPEAYNNSVAVRFAMDLSNVENTEKLAVPVQITLPIPSNINPEFLAILHYHADGTFEEITLPYVFSEGGQYYARFVVNGFSDFVLTEYAPEEEEPDADVTRIAGKSRYLTAIAAADVLMETLGVAEFDSIVIASGNEFPDALAGSYLAAVKKAPILLSTKKSDADNLKYIQDNLSSDGTVYILGGTTAVSDSIETMLKTAGINVKRLAGKDRYKTNLLILEEAGFSGGEVLVAIGNNFADSLSASATGKPILLVGPKWDKISADYVNFLSGKTCSFTIIGGEGAVKEAIETDLKNYGSVRRIFGSNRLQTSVKVAETFFDSPSAAVLACSTNFPDGLCGGPLAYALGAPLLLVNVNKEATPAAYVSANMIKTGFVMGGEAVVSEDSVKAVF